MVRCEKRVSVNDRRKYRQLRASTLVRQVCVVNCVVTVPSLPMLRSLARCHSALELCQPDKATTATKTVSPDHSDFFGVASSRTDSRFDTVEVCGSSPFGPTIFSTSSVDAQECRQISKCLPKIVPKKSCAQSARAIHTAARPWVDAHGATRRDIASS